MLPTDAVVIVYTTLPLVYMHLAYTLTTANFRYTQTEENIFYCNQLSTLKSMCPVESRQGGCKLHVLWDAVLLLGRVLFQIINL